MPAGNMSDIAMPPARLFRIASAGICLFFTLCLALAAFTWNRDAVYFGDAVYFADGDCYARMTRARMFLEHPLTPIRHHEFENYPQGTAPHTTLPLDALIAGLASLLGGISGDPLSAAGAWVSPLLGLAMLGGLAVWGVRIPYRNAMLISLVASPIVSHGFLLGRPDHQSLLMLLVAAALAAEIAIWRGAKWGAVSAASWALALWVSLFEPAVLLAAVLSGRVAFRRLEFSKIPAAIFCGILLMALVWDGFRVAAFDPRFANWARNIGELRHGSPAVLVSWVGWLVVPAPFLLGFRAFRARDPLCALLAWLLVLLIALSLWHVRWGYFLALVFAISLPWILISFRWRLAGWAVFVIALWPVAAAWEQTLFPDGELFRARGESVADAVALRDAAVRLRDLPRHGVIAPWWFSPAVVWWSSQPCVAGTSHQSLPGIAETAEFFLSESRTPEIPRQAGYAITYEPDRVISNSAQILGREAPPNPLVKRLHEHPCQPGFQLVHANRFFKVFRIVNPGGSDASGT